MTHPLTPEDIQHAIHVRFPNAQRLSQLKHAPHATPWQKHTAASLDHWYAHMAYESAFQLAPLPPEKQAKALADFLPEGQYANSFIVTNYITAYNKLDVAGAEQQTLTIVSNQAWHDGCISTLGLKLPYLHYILPAPLPNFPGAVWRAPTQAENLLTRLRVMWMPFWDKFGHNPTTGRYDLAAASVLDALTHTDAYKTLADFYEDDLARQNFPFQPKAA